MWRISVLILVALAVTMPAHAKANKDKKHEATSGTSLQRTNVDRRESFIPAERNMIRAQLQQHEREKEHAGHKNLPPGLQNKVARGKVLPPGWQKKVAVGQRLDYQVYRQGKSLPEDILRRLPQSPIGSEILRIEDKIIRLHSATRTILDVFDLTPAH